VSDPADPAIRGESFRTQSTSRRTAEVSPVVLRTSDRTRLVFKPVLVDNANNADAAVRGTFIYQRQGVGGVTWDDPRTINLSALKGGEGVRLELASVEVLELYRALGQLYQMVLAEGIPVGQHSWVALPNTPITAELRALLTEPVNVASQQLFQMFAGWLRQQDASALSSILSASNVADLLDFDAAVGAARLRQFLDEARANLGNPHESYWQSLFEQHSWVLSEIYAHPVVIVAGRAYVGGKGVSNTGGNLADFLYQNKLTGNALIIEIKTPLTELLEASEYRNGVFAPSRELAGATQQLVHYRSTLVDQRTALAEDSGMTVYSPRCLLVCGTLPDASHPARVRSFERFRGSLRDVDVITYDELIAKVELLLELLARGD
jgi:hypothetical protein